MKYIKAFNNSNDLEIYRKSKFVSPHLFLNKQNLRDIHYLEEYDQLYYISSTKTGGQYIDLGCKLFETTDEVQIEIKFNLKGIGKDNNTQAVLLGSNDEAQNNVWPGLLIRRNNSNIQCKIKNVNFDCYINNQQVNVGVNNGNYLPSDSLFSLNSIYEVKLITTNWNNNSTHSKNVSLFAGLNSSGTPFRYSESDIHYLKLIKGGNVIRNLVPVKRKSDNAVGLYDIENDHLYVSQGDEQFIAGPKVIHFSKYNKFDCPYQTIEYLKYDNTSYIDTNINIDYELLNNAKHIEYITDSKFLDNGAEGKNKLYFFIGVNNEYFYSGLGNSYNTNSSIYNDYKRHIIKLEKKNNEVTLYVDNQIAQSYNYEYSSVVTNPSSFYLFKCLQATNFTSCNQEKYYVKLTIDNTVLFEMIPVRIGNTGYMYDIVRKQLFGTETNPFLLGPDI